MHCSLGSTPTTFQPASYQRAATTNLRRVTVWVRERERERNIINWRRTYAWLLFSLFFLPTHKVFNSIQFQLKTRRRAVRFIVSKERRKQHKKHRWKEIRQKPRSFTLSRSIRSLLVVRAKNRHRSEHVGTRQAANNKLNNLRLFPVIKTCRAFWLLLCFNISKQRKCQITCWSSVVADVSTPSVGSSSNRR